MVAALEMLGIAVLVPAGIVVGRRAGKAGSGWWGANLVVGFGGMALMILGRRSMTLSFVAPMAWAIHPYVSPLLTALAIPLMIETLRVRMPMRRQRTAVAVLMWVMLGYYAVLPLVLPAAVRGSLAATPGKFDRNRTCLQTHTYTYGPAAAVTCLACLNVPAEEGAMAIAAESAPAMGTDPTLLAMAINRSATPHNIHCRYQMVGSLDRLTTPAIANLFSTQYGGHYVAVLRVTPTTVLVGDPLSGQASWTREEFLREWTGAAHEFERMSP